MKRLPVVVAIDMEPDPRKVDPRDPAPWTGFEVLRAHLEGLRTSLAAATGSPVHWSWFVRVDEQVRIPWGSTSWALTRYERELESARARGDEVGAHVHAYRRDDASASWIVEHGDARFIESAVRGGLDAFARATGSPCRSFRFGDRWLDAPTASLLEELGVRFDLTLEPGMPALPSLDRTVPHTGSIPDCTAVPARPYRPSRADCRLEDPSRTEGLWMLPITTGRVPRGLALLRALYRGLMRAPDESLGVVALNPALPSVLFRRIAAPLLHADGPGCLVLPTRSDAGVRPHALRRIAANLAFLVQASSGRVTFATPEEALELWLSASRGSSPRELRGHGPR